MRSFISLSFLFLVCGCSEAGSNSTDSILSMTMKTAGGENLKLEDGSELVLPEGTFSSPVAVTFSRLNCGGIFASSSFSSCQYSVAFDGAPNQRFEVNLAGKGALTSKGDDGYRPVGVLHEQSALTTRVFALRAGDDARCFDVEFSACGGDLLGAWELENACGPRSEILSIYSTSNSDPYARCGEGEALREYPFTTSKKLTFDVNGQYEEVGGFNVQKREVVTQACLETIGESCHQLCDLNDGVCTCLFDNASGEGAGGGSWAYDVSSTTSFIFNGPTPEEGEESGPGVGNDYCVNGDTLTVRQKGRSAVFVYRRN